MCETEDIPDKHKSILSAIATYEADPDNVIEWEVFKNQLSGEYDKTDFSVEHKLILEKRIAEYKENPSCGVSLDQFIEELKAQGSSDA